MSFYAIIPFKPINPKTRLSCVLTQAEREAFARAMLDDVISEARRAGCRPVLLSTTPFTHKEAKTVVKNMGLNEALNECLKEVGEPILILMSDLPLVTAEAIRRICSTQADVAIVPGRGGGTNTLFVRRPEAFQVDFYGASFLDHMNIAQRAGLSVDVVDSFRLHTDVDEKEDLVEVLLHAKGKAREYLVSRGFSLSIEKGRVGIQRDTHEETF